MPESVLTVYGRQPVLEALKADHVTVDAIFLARNAHGDSVDDILAAAAERGVRVQRVAPDRITRISGNGRHDQGVAAEVAAPGMQELPEWLPAAPVTFRLFVLDGVTNPSNVGMIIRTAAAAGLDGVVVPRAGVADIGPLVIKASAGVAFSATLLRAGTAEEAVRLLRSAGARVVGLDAGSRSSIYDLDVSGRVALVLGNETEGVRVDVDETAAIPLQGGVGSLNVATAAAVVAFEFARRGRR